MTFYCKFIDDAIIKVNANLIVKQYFDEFFCGCNSESEQKYKYEINFKGKNLGDVDIPKHARLVHGFMAPKYYVWQKDSKNYSYSPKEEKMGSHLVISDGHRFDIYLHSGISEEIVMRIAREIFLRELLQRGFLPLHASAVRNKDGKVNIYFGPRNAGKTVMLFKKVIKDGANPIANDMLMIKESKGHYEVYGWPIRVSFQNFIVNYFNLDYPLIDENIKTKISPQKFVSLTKCDGWAWHQTNVDNIIFISKDKVGQASIEQVKEVEKQDITPYLKDAWNWGDFLKIFEETRDFETSYSSFDIKILKGNSLEYGEENNI